MILFALSGVASRAAAQTQSPAIGPSRITVDDPIGQGDEIELAVSVANLGDLTQTFAMAITHPFEQPELIADPSWFRLEPQQFDLEAGQGRVVAVRMSVPRDAEVGDYLVLVQAKGVRDPSGTGVQISAAVAMTLRFSVKNVNFHFYDPVVDFYGDRSPFSWIGSGLLIGLSAVYMLQRRYGLDISVGVRRKQ